MVGQVKIQSEIVYFPSDLLQSQQGVTWEINKGQATINIKHLRIYFYCEYK